jgi:ribokinase
MKVAVVGSYGVGMTMRLPRVPVAGETLLGGTYTSGHGGKGSNQAVAAARLGAEVTFLTAVGDDAFGRAARDLWAAEGVDASATVTVPDAATMVGMILVEPSGENRIVIAGGALDHLSVDHVEAFLPHLAGADIAVVSLEIPLETALAAIRSAHAAGTRTLLNPAPAQALPEDAWAHIDVLTPNRTEAAILLGHDPDADESPESLAAQLHAKGVRTVVLTLGGDGALVHDGAGQRLVPAARPTAVVDTTGAGDAFTAALAVGLASHEPIDAAVRFAAQAGAHAVSIHEVIPALPHRVDLAGTSTPEPSPMPGQP